MKKIEELELCRSIVKLMEKFKRANRWNSDLEMMQEKMVDLNRMIASGGGSTLFSCLKVKIDNGTYFIPSRNIVEVINCSRGKGEDVVIYNLEGCLIMGYCGRLVPLIHLSMNIQESSDNIVIVRSDYYVYGLPVDQIYGMEDVEIEKIKGLSERYLGGALTGAGRVILTLDIDRIGEDYKVKRYDGDILKEIDKSAREEERESGSFLLFHLGEHKNYAVALEEVVRIESISVEKARSMPLIWVKRALGLAKGRTLKSHIENSRSVNVVVVRGEREQRGLVVEEIVGIESTTSEVDANISDRRGIAGVVVLGERVVSVVDVDCLFPPSESRKSIAA